MDAAGAGPGEKKTVFFVRHAESTNNVAKREARAALAGLGRFELPSWAQWRHIISLLSVPMDTALSQQGCEQRARETCRGLFAEAGVPILEHPEIFEKDVGETLQLRNLRDRVERFEDWLGQRPERRLAIVGHSAFLREMAGVEANNVDVWELSFSPTAGDGPASGEPRWDAPLLLFPGSSAGAVRQHH